MLDHYSASASDPLYDLRRQEWWEPGWHRLERLAGTIDALAEAYSVGGVDVGDTMVMYGSTMFLVQMIARPAVHPGLWAAVGRTPGSYATAAGMSTSGLITQSISEITNTDFDTLTEGARRVAAGSDGLLLLPYFAGERTPIFDPQARGAWIGMTLRHSRGHLYRSALEAIGFGVRHNLQTMTDAGAQVRHLVAVGGGTRGDLWTQIVTNVTGLPQDIPTTTVGASYSDARLVADALGVDTRGWNPVTRRIEPDLSTRDVYDLLFEQYLSTYPALAPTMHTLAGLNR